MSYGENTTYHTLWMLIKQYLQGNEYLHLYQKIRMAKINEVHLIKITTK